jgi:hypothetical protein
MVPVLQGRGVRRRMILWRGLGECEVSPKWHNNELDVVTIYA